MPHDLVSAIKALRKEDTLSAYEVEQAIRELAQWVQQLQDDVDELRQQSKRRSR